MSRRHGRDSIMVKFAPATCRPCPARGACTAARDGRQISLRPREIHQAATAAQAAPDGRPPPMAGRPRWQAAPDGRPGTASGAGVEGTISEATHVTGIRRARYLGLPKTRLEHIIVATALNLIRLDAWWTGEPIGRARTPV